ncbi:FimV/HubP family polar landmark protein [Pseudomonas oleovorans]|uniref:FimV/HubP family polar landmark protein n=1 Tax=Ectopseudomonas oleovorans TaxID=301 RepID=UPI0028EBE232|nr:FimV/HubP family polar landmark protein [Pseudomonas oleovorans]
MAPALGLGEITLHSALNQPFEAEIELLEVGDLGAQDLRVGLAPAEVFSRSGVERFYFLNDLRFTPLLQGSRSVIRVVSNRPVREPYLNFIVEVARPNGQLLREYTVLLDPPGSSAYSAVTAPSAAAVSQPSNRTAAPASSVRAVTPPRASAGHRHQVSRGDSLWSIAARLREQGSTLSQQALMEGILALNPNAFAGGDPSRLQAGAELLLPDAARAEAAPPSAAPVAAEASPVLAENTAEGPVSAPLAALEPAPQQSESLELLAERQRQVDLELANQAAENLQLQQGLAQLQLQLQQLQEQLAQKDAQLAELAARTPAEPAAQPITVAPVSVEEPAAAERGWWSTLLAGGIGLLLLLGALFWAVRRRGEKTRPVVQVQPKGQPPQQPPRPLLAAVGAAPVVKAVPAPAPVRAQGPVDPLEAANVYIAYGRFSEARGELSKALAQDPQRSDLRFRLLEVLALLGDGAGFAREEAVLRAEAFDAARIDALKARHPDLRVTQQVPTEVIAEQQPAAEPDFQLNLDDLSLDADWDLVSPFPAAAKAKPKAAAEPEFDPSFASNLQELPEVFELHHEDEQLSAFSEMEMVLSDEVPALDDNFIDAFAGDADATAALQGDIATACDILNEVIDNGDDEQRKAARQLLAEIA